MNLNDTLTNSNSTNEQFSISNAILLINTIFTLATPILYMILKMIKKCQFGRDTFIETRSDGGSNTPVNNVTNNLPTASQIFGRVALNRAARIIENPTTTSNTEETTIVNNDNK